MKLFKDTIIDNPKGWAKNTVGTVLGYRLMQLVTVMGAASLFVFFIIPYKNPSGGQLMAFSTQLFVFAILLPLCYLRALRHLCLKSRNKL